MDQEMAPIVAWLYTRLNRVTVVLGSLWLIQLFTPLGVELSTVLKVWLLAYAGLVTGTGVFLRKELQATGNSNPALGGIIHGFIQWILALFYMVVMAAVAGVANLFLGFIGRGTSFFELWVGSSACVLIAIQAIQLLLKLYSLLTNPRRHRNGGYAT